MGVRPMWEDEKNRHGGRWIVNLDKKQRASSLDHFWLDVMLYMIGESFDGDNVNGAVVNVRNRGDKIAIWLREARCQESVMKIGKSLKKCSGLTTMFSLDLSAIATLST